MAHFIIYKRPTEVTPYSVDFTDLMPNDTALSAAGTTVKVYDSAGADQTTYFLSSFTLSGKVVTAKFNVGLDGEDYLVYFDGVGNTTTPNKFNRLLEVRVRSKLSGNL